MDFPTRQHMDKALGFMRDVPLNNCGSSAMVSIPSGSVVPTCMTPTLPDPELANASIDELTTAFQLPDDICGHIKEMHSRMLISDANAALGQGAWPPGKQCHPDHYPYDNFHAVLFYVDHDDLMSNSSLDREVTDDEWHNVVVRGNCWPSIQNPAKSVAECKKEFIYPESDIGVERAKRVAGKKIGSTLNLLDMGLWLIREATRRIGCYLLEVFTGPNGKHSIHFRTNPMPGSLAGLGYFPDGSCGDHVTANIDSLISYTLGWLAGLGTHEVGHTLDWRHEFSSPQSRHRSIMSYAQDNSPFQGYREKGGPYNYEEDHTWARARKVYGGEAARSIPGDDVGTIIIPKGERIELDLEIIKDDKGQPIILNEFEVQGRTFIIVPRPII